MVQNLMTGTILLLTTLWSRMSTGDLFEEMSEWEIYFLVLITALHIITHILPTFKAKIPFSMKCLGS